VLPPRNAGDENKGSATTGAKATGKCYHRENTINGSHRVLLPGNKRNAAIKNISYGAYGKGGVLLSGEYYKRKP